MTSIEGTPTTGPFRVETLAEGAQMAMMRVELEAGVRSEDHVHSHESMLFVLSGSVATIVDGERIVLHAGDACRHPENVRHRVEAVEDSVFLEIKAPAPELDRVLGR